MQAPAPYAHQHQKKRDSVCTSTGEALCISICLDVLSLRGSTSNTKRHRFLAPAPPLSARHLPSVLGNWLAVPIQGNLAPRFPTMRSLFRAAVASLIQSFISTVPPSSVTPCSALLLHLAPCTLWGWSRDGAGAQALRRPPHSRPFLLRPPAAPIPELGVLGGLASVP